MEYYFEVNKEEKYNRHPDKFNVAIFFLFLSFFSSSLYPILMENELMLVGPPLTMQLVNTLPGIKAKE